MTAIIQIEHLNFHYSNIEDEPVLKDVNLKIQKGDWVAVIGKNGSGKSTLAKCINGLLVPDSGVITVAGQILSEETVWSIRDKIGIVFQNPDNQFVGATVEDDVAFGMENRGVPREEMLVRVQEALKQVGMLEFAKKEPARLSGGQKQRVAIAGIIAQRPEIIILDESTSMLDPQGRQEVLATIRKIKEANNLTVISITHDIEETVHSNQIAILSEGKIVETNTPSKIFAYGQELIKLGLDVPFSEQLKTKLAQAGVDMPHDYLDDERMIEYLWTLHSKM